MGKKTERAKLPSLLPLIAIEASPVLPGLMASLHVPPGKSVLAVNKALKKNRIVGLLLPKKDLRKLLTNKESRPCTAASLPAEIMELADTEEGSIDIEIEIPVSIAEKSVPGVDQDEHDKRSAEILDDDKDEAPRLDYRLQDLYKRGVSVRILKRILMPDGSMNLLVHGLERFEVVDQIQKDPYLCATVKYFLPVENKSQEIEALARNVIQQVKNLSNSSPFFTEEMKIAMINSPSPGTLADMVAFAIALQSDEAQRYVETVDVHERFMKLLVYLRKEKDMAEVQNKLSAEVDSRVAKFQREFFLKEQLKSIKTELGMEEDDKSRETKFLREKLEKANLPEHAQKIADEELRRIQTIPEASPEFNVARSYMEWIADLPWSVSTQDNLNLKHAREILDRDHFGLDDVKNRILEFLAVRSLRPEAQGSILCFSGPPGVGKTSLGKAIAEALGRKYFRFSLGGMRDESEIKGHRRTYVGAMPGKILQGLKRVGANNALIMLDEIDKMGSSYQGDPASALLEVLDPEQNHGFLDHYLDIPFDLSKVMFVANANNLDAIPPALLDRMEVIELAGYTQEEKEVIAKKYVIPESLRTHGLKRSTVRFPVKTLRTILNDYAREPGVRSLKKQTDKICRRVARMKVEKKLRKPVQIESNQLHKWLGPQRFYNENAERALQPGVMTGLAWTPLGGEILFIEALALPGTGDFKLTGQMGDVMSESAKIALSHVRKYLGTKKGFTIASLENEEQSKVRLTPQEWFKKHDIHLHLPAGAVPKDGPSAGITMACALLSLVSGRIARPRMAMTGELSLVGKVLPVGGIKDKVLAAKRAGIRHIAMPELNKKDIREIPAGQLKGLTFSYTSHIEQVFDLALRRT